MFGSEEKKQAKAEARAREEERRINEAGSREREKIDREKVGREPGPLHKIDYFDEKLNEHSEKVENKRVDRARKREARSIRREKQRKFWILAAIIVALLVGAGAGYLLCSHNHQKADYQQGCQLIIDKNFDTAQVILTDVTYKDGENLYTYAQMRNSVKEYYGKTDVMLDTLNSLEGMENAQVNAQYNKFLAQVKPVGTLQKSINKLHVNKLKMKDQEKVKELNRQVKTLESKYSDLLDTTRLKKAQKRLEIMQEANDKIKAQKEKRQKEEETTEATQATE